MSAPTEFEALAALAELPPNAMYAAGNWLLNKADAEARDGVKAARAVCQFIYHGSRAASCSEEPPQ